MLISLLALLPLAGVSAWPFRRSAECSVIETVTDFDIEKFIEKTWFVQRQQVNSYQPEESLVCVSATYEDEGNRNWFKPAISVYNYDSRSENDAPEPLCATRPDPDDEPAKLQVVPCGLPNFFAGPYWVAALGPDYEWAIIVGGQPEVEGRCDSDENLCTTREGYFGGLWFFTRVRIASEDTLNTMEQTALDLGLCTANMLDVVQEGCTYEGHRIKE